VDRGSKPAQANNLKDPILKISNTKRAGKVVQGVGPEFKPWHHTNTHKKKPRVKQVQSLLKG
jgi:hypothetical protein